MCLKYCLSGLISCGIVIRPPSHGATHASTLENSDEGDMTKLSFVLDHEIRCWML